LVLDPTALQANAGAVESVCASEQTGQNLSSITAFVKSDFAFDEQLQEKSDDEKLNTPFCNFVQCRVHADAWLQQFEDTRHRGRGRFQGGG
jgi:hypothetical protein